MLPEISEMNKEMKAAGKILTPWKTLVIEALLVSDVILPLTSSVAVLLFPRILILPGLVT